MVPRTLMKLLVVAATALCCRRNDRASAVDAAPAGPRIDRSCRTVVDCIPTCMVGPVNKAWWTTAHLRSCMDGCDGAVACVQNTCVPTQAVENGAVDWKHHCLEQTHLQPDQINPALIGDSGRRVSAILTDPKRLAAHGVTFAAIRAALEAARVEVIHAGPSARGQSFLILIPTAAVTEALGETTIAAGDAAVVVLKDVATLPGAP